MPWIEAMLTIDPPPLRSIRCTATEHPNITPNCSTPMPRSIRSAVISWAAPGKSMPAFETQ